MLLYCFGNRILRQDNVLQGSSATLLQYISFLRPEIQEASDVAKNIDKLSEEDKLSKFADLLKTLTLRRLQAEISQRSPTRMEIQIPVEFLPEQAEFYKQVLSRFYDILVESTANKPSSTRAGQSKAICDELRKVCNDDCYRILQICNSICISHRWISASGFNLLQYFITGKIAI